MTEFRKRAHECWMSGTASDDDCANCFNCIDEPYHVSEFMPQFRALVKAWRKAKKLGWTREKGNCEHEQHWMVTGTFRDKGGHKHYLRVNRDGEFVPVPIMMCWKDRTPIF